MKRYPLASRALLFIVLPALLLMWFAYQTYFVAALPQTSGIQALKDLTHDIEISRDKNGVPFIQAQSDSDVYFAMGYVHAQDRMWQLEVQRRISQGRLSEVFGKTTVPQDVWIRTLGLYERAKSSEKHLSQQALSSLQSYAAGINAWLETDPTLPIEFTLYGVEPEPWTVSDSLAWIKVFALNLGLNFRIEMQRYVAFQFLTDEQIQDLFPNHFIQPKIPNRLESVTDLQGISNLLALQKEFELEWHIGGRSVGSNAWVISGKHTASGSPILANDPHLGLQIPSLWYPVVQQGTELNVSGMSLVGLPVVIFGKNQHIAWGGTNMMADVQDLYIEHLNSFDSEQYLVGDQWYRFNSRIEQINVKADFPAFLREPLEPIEIQVRNSIHGPIISDAVTGINQPVALQWTALDETDTTYESLYALSYADNWQAFKGALSHLVAPALNMLYIDSEHNIGFIGAGKIPIRNSGDGELPVPGSDPEYRWNDYIPFEQMPQSLNPQDGYLISSNNRNVDENYPHFISSDWANPARSSRIRQLILEKISSHKQLTVKDMQQIQADNKDLSAMKLLSQMKSLKGQNEQQIKALHYLSKWDGHSSLSSQGASVFYSWLRHLRQELFADELKNYWNHAGAERYLNATVANITPDTIVDVLTKKRYWCDIESTELTESCEDILYASLQHMIEEISKLAGHDIEQWQWGELQMTMYAPIVPGPSEFLNVFFERTIANGGASHAVNVATSQYSQSDGYLQRFGAGFRQIINFDDTVSGHIYMNSTGQSGQLASPHYDDMVEKFRNVEYVNFPHKPVGNEKLTLVDEQAAGSQP